MTAVRIAHAEPRPGNLGNGTFLTRGYLVVLADDEGHRAMPLWFRGQPGGGSLAKLLDRSYEDLAPAGSPEKLITRLLRAAGASVTGVDIDIAEAGAGERADVGGMDPAAYTARVELVGPAGTTHVTVPLGLGLAMAAAGDAPVRMPGAVLDRQAVPVQGDDLLGPLLDLVPEVGRAPGGRVAGWPARLPAKRPRYEPRNLDFADGLDRWELDGSFLRDGGSGQQDYLAAAEGPSAVLSAAVERPAGSAALMQTIFADDYLGATVVFRGEIRTEPLTYEAGFRLEVLRERRRVRDDRAVTVSGQSTWTPYEVTAVVPGDADRIRFGITLVGPGKIVLRFADLTRRD
jgi:hypothetical protein